MTDPVQAAIYCRLSLARDGDTTKVNDQERICRELATNRGWPIAEHIGHPLTNGVFSDNNRSAWQQNRKRPAWTAMLAAIDSGDVNAIVTYHGDRLLRTHEDLIELIHRARTKGLMLASPSGTRDIGDYEDQFILEIEASMAKRESANTSRRRKQQYIRWRAEGKVRAGGKGGRPYGFATGGTEHVPAEVKIIREIADRILSGESVLSICRVLNKRGLRTTAGSPWTHSTMKKMMRRPRYVGLMPDGESRGAWEPVLDRETWEAVAATLNTRKGTRTARKYLLSGLAVCGRCGSGLQARSEGAARAHLTSYGCVRPGCRGAQRNIRLLDAYVTRRVVNRLSHEANLEAHIPDAPGLAAQFAALTTWRGETIAAISDPGQALAPLQARLENIDQRLAELRELSAGDARHRLLAAHVGISEDKFAGLPLSVRRAVVAACYTVVVLPASGRGPGFRPEDVRLTAR